MRKVKRSEHDLSAEEEAPFAFIDPGLIAVEIVDHELQIVTLDVIVQAKGTDVARVAGHPQARVKLFVADDGLEVFGQNVVAAQHIPAVGLKTIGRDVIVRLEAAADIFRLEVEGPDLDLGIDTPGIPVADEVVVHRPTGNSIKSETSFGDAATTAAILRGQAIDAHVPFHGHLVPLGLDGRALNASRVHEVVIVVETIVHARAVEEADRIAHAFVQDRSRHT